MKFVLISRCLRKVDIYSHENRVCHVERRRVKCIRRRRHLEREV